MTPELKAYIQSVVEKTEHTIIQALTQIDPDIATIYDAMQYSVLGGGKRVRPFMCVAVSDMFSADDKAAVIFGAALEMVHTYSLIHDDLPCMDNDDLRRGRPTCHKVFGEANALLAGDALLVEAFRLLAHANLPQDKVVKAIQILSDAAGAFEMIGGQIMDIKAETEALKSLDHLKKLYAKKTGAMLLAAVKMGLVASSMDHSEYAPALETYGANVGLAFQVVDDYLDEYATEDMLGKPIGSDKANGKITFLSWMSGQEALQYAEMLTKEACQAIASIPKSNYLQEFAEEMLHRNK